MEKRGWHHVYMAAKTLAILGVLGAVLLAALWLASFFLYASLRVNPLHAGIWGWLDAARAWHDGGLPKEGRRLAGSAIFGLLVAFGGPGLGLSALPERPGHRPLYGRARVANHPGNPAAGAPISPSP